MITELYRLAQNLRLHKSEREWVHADFGVPGMSTYKTFHLILKEAGDLRLELMGNPDDYALWTLKSGNFKYFPAFRPDSPLIDIAMDQLEKSPTKESLLAILKGTDEDRTRKSIWEKSLAGIQGQVERILKWKSESPLSDEGMLLQQFVNGFKRLIENRERFEKALFSALIELLETNSFSANEINTLQTLIYGTFKESKNKAPKNEYKIQILLDYQPENSLQGILYTQRMKDVVLKSLIKEPSPSPKKKESDGGYCSLENMAGKILREPYPDWAANAKIVLRNKKTVTVGFGKAFKPYSKFSDAKCNYRYGKADSEGFIIGKDIAGELVSAGASVTRPDLYGDTWKTIKNGKFTEKNGKKSPDSDVIIAYPTFKTERLNAVCLISKSQEQEEEGAERKEISFKAESQRFFNALEKGCGVDEIKNYIRLLILRQISNGQVQLVYSEEYALRHVKIAIQKWLCSGANLPSRLQVPVPSKKHEFFFASPDLLFPEMALEAFTYKWIDGGKRNARLQSPPIGEVMDLFFQRDGVWQEAATRLLEILLPRMEALVTGAGLYLPRESYSIYGAEAREFFTSERSYALKNSVSLLGTLLYFSDSNVTQYMKETPYLFGQLLAGLDELHKAYCVGVRDGNIPPSLIGNAALGKASDSPEEALAELSERSRIYLAWADTVDRAPLRDQYAVILGILKEKGELTKEQWAVYRKQNAIVTAKRLLRKLEFISRELHETTFTNDPMTAQQKAHLFLGYLSRVTEDNAVSEKKTDNQDNQ